MAGHQVEIVAGTVQIGRHGGNEITAVLFPVGLTQLDPRDLGHRVPLVGRLQRPGQKRVLAHRLIGQLGIDAARSQEHQFFHPGAVGTMDDIRFDHHVVVDEVRGVGRVGENAADLRRRQEHGIGPDLFHPSLDLGLASQVDGGAAHGHDLAVLGGQPPNQSRSDHAPVARHPDTLAGQAERGVSHRRGPVPGRSRRPPPCRPRPFP